MKWNVKNPPCLPNKIWGEARMLTRFRLCNAAPSVPVDYFDRMLDNWEDPIVADAMIEIAVELAEQYKFPLCSLRTIARCQELARMAERMSRIDAATLRFLKVDDYVIKRTRYAA